MARVAAVVLIAGALVGCGIVRLGAAPQAVDLNTASASAFAGLPGLSAEDGRRIVAGRPYAAKEDLLRRKVVSAEQYAAIADRLYVGPPEMPEYLRWVPPQPQGP